MIIKKTHVIRSVPYKKTHVIRSVPYKKENSFSSITILVIISFLMYGCASSYKTAEVSTLAYNEPKNVNDALRVSYMYGVQKVFKNKRYARKEKKYKMASIGLKIENTSSASITLTRDNFKVYTAAGEKRILPPAVYTTRVKQRIGFYLLHSLWGPWQVSWREDEQGKTHIEEGYYIPLGMIVGVGNSIKASNANKEAQAVLEFHEIWNREIAPGEILYGIVIIQSEEQEPLTFSFVKDLNQDELMKKVDALMLTKNTLKSKVHDFVVIPETGGPYNVNSKIHISGEKHFIMNGSTKIYPQDTKNLSTMTFDNKQLLGISRGNHWLFKIISGKISAYHFLAEEDSNIISYLQMDDGELMIYTPSLLADMVNHEPNIMALIMRGKINSAIKRYNDKNKFKGRR